MSAFGIVLSRDLLLAWRRPVNCWLPAAFFVVAVSLFPLGVGSEPQILRQIAGGIVWVCALLSALLGLGFLFDADFEDGSLEQMVLSGHSLAEISAAKCTVHWLLTGVPLIIAGPVAGLLLGLDAFPL
ncbi:MAG: heme exporter protein CcmB, partial [Pseudomonadota bacterium]